ncbi:hypothetical protein KSF_080030 [Reticulibacter mediterranei]|uniref:Uncharacterized protein n=1 Tax=Reticulibacter mediterranei TaxID=2778369 RepID=A0A8J3ISX5_9CHLR|nr:hypothetical protein KSF_080030 [Reticulibacter mediterranei]
MQKSKKIYVYLDRNGVAVWLQKGKGMKNIFNNRRMLVCSIFVVLAILSELVLFLCHWLLHLDIPSFAFIIPFMCFVVSGGYLIALRGEPPW